MELPATPESSAVPRPLSLEDRRLAVVAALRAIAAEPAPEPSMVEAVVDAVDSRLDELSERLDEVLARLGSVETTLLETAWERSAPEAVSEPEPVDDVSDPTVSVPAVDLAEGRMSSSAAKALFGH